MLKAYDRRADDYVISIDPYWETDVEQLRFFAGEQWERQGVVYPLFLGDLGVLAAHGRTKLYQYKQLLPPYSVLLWRRDYHYIVPALTRAVHKPQKERKKKGSSTGSKVFISLHSEQHKQIGMLGIIRSLSDISHPTRT